MKAAFLSGLYNVAPGDDPRPPGLSGDCKGLLGDRACPLPPEVDTSEIATRDSTSPLGLFGECSDVLRGSPCPLTSETDTSD